jgi:hypothetical protein
MMKRKRAVYKKPVRRFKPKAKPKTAIQKYIPMLSPIEKKYMDTVYTTQAITGGASNIYLLNGNVQGTSQTTRVGNRATIKNIELNFNFTNTVASNIKCMLVIDKEPQATAFSISALLNAIGGNYLPWSLRNSVNSQRFVTIKNIELVLNPNVSATAVLKKIKKYIKCNLPVQYNGGNAGTVADITANALYMVFLSDANPTVLWSSRLRYTDD